MKNKLICICLLWLLWPQQNKAQIDNNKAHRRYWYYRTRMINDFMKIGKDQGECIVFAERNEGQSPSDTTSYYSKAGPDQIDLTNHYIMALALEYKLLTRGNQDPSETIYELFHLLWTINRLDQNANSSDFWGGPIQQNPYITPYTGNLDGFMIREDMPPDFLTKNIDHYNYTRLLPPSGQPRQGFCGTAYTDKIEGNKFLQFLLDPYHDNAAERDSMAMPHDKFHSMLTALMFIDKYIPSSVTYAENGSVQSFQDGETSLKQEARNIAKRIYDYLKDAGDAWILVYPDFTQQNNHTVRVGAVALPYSWPLSRMACHVNDDFPWSSLDPCVNYTDPTALGIGLQVYKSLSLYPQPSQDAAVFMAWDQAGSNYPSFNPIPIPAYTTMNINDNKWHLEWAELLRKVLHQDGVLLQSQSVFENSIAQAPCFGPYNYSNDPIIYYGSWEWSSQDRLEHPDSRGSKSPFAANYPGADYMLLHNLFYEYQNQLMEGNSGNVGNASGLAGNIITVVINTISTIANWINGNTNSAGGLGTTGPIYPYYAYNLMDNHDNSIWPRKIGSITYGTSANQQYIAMYQNLSSNAHIYANASPLAANNNLQSNVKYRAGKEIVLTDGFIVEKGSEFDAIVQRFICRTDSGAGGETSRNSNGLSLGSYDYENDNYNELPIHYVESPKSVSDLNPVPLYQNTGEEQTEIAKAINVAVFPNPSSGLINLAGPSLNGEETADISITDAKGMEIISRKGQTNISSVNFDLSAYGKGLYMIIIRSSYGNVLYKKVTIE